MTDAAAPDLYPQYCFHLSPTINRWCHLRTADVLALTSHPGFQGQDVYFHLNHPIKWVRVAGVVVAVDEREARHFYTIDDGSGAAIECVVNLAPRAAPGAAANGNSNQPQPLAAIDAPIDVGHVLDIKGSVSTFRDRKNIRVEKIAHLRSTEQEVAFWEKVALLRREVLSKPWVLDRREVKRCRREEEGRHASRRDREASGRHSRERGTGVEKGAKRPRGENEARRRPEKKPLVKGRVRETGLEKRRPTRPLTRLIPLAGNYDALGF